MPGFEETQEANVMGTAYVEVVVHEEDSPAVLYFLFIWSKRKKHGISGVFYRK